MFRYRYTAIRPTILTRASLIAAGLWAAILLTGCGDPQPDTVDQAVATRQDPAAAERPGAPGADADPSTAEMHDPATYTGSEACADCHPNPWQGWRGSHHDLALQRANPDSVLARFQGTHEGSSFQAADGKFVITPEPDQPQVPVLYTFGVEPLQQYVVPAQAGALQTFPIAWDSRPAAAGGQRWFNLHAAVYPAGDPMHWTGRANRWNSQCADCHSTAVSKAYDPDQRTWSTTFAVEDVGCEACHGPGSLHVADPTNQPLATLDSQLSQINACAPCHSRRSQLAEGFLPTEEFLDYYLPRLLDADLYHVDGQIDDEVYVYGSFLQSRMHHAGVTCGDCHDPHGAGLQRPGNATCTHCHQADPSSPFAALSAGVYDSREHHLHEPGTPGSACVDCHMPSKTYMGVDARRDHGFRIPRPDLADTLGVPDPCDQCHAAEPSGWARAVLSERYGEPAPHFASAFAAADRAEAGADAALAALVEDDEQPIMVRASALARLAGYQRGYTMDAIRLARKAEPLLRLAAPLAAESLGANLRWRLLGGLLEDPLRAVRHATVVALLPSVAEDPRYRERLEPHLAAWSADLSLNLDYPETHTTLASAAISLGDLDAAEAHLNEALRQQPSWVPGMLNLADLYRRTARDSDAGSLLTRALTLAPDQAEVHYAYGLWLSRHNRLADGLPHFARAAALAPDQLALGYAWAIALNDSGDGSQAVQVLEELLARWPENEQLLLAAVTMLRDQGQFAEALPLIDRLLQLRPGDQQLLQFREALAAAAASV
jgi:Tfp pilus assembly protein PilF